MGLDKATVTELTAEHDDDYRLTLATEHARVDITMQDQTRQMLTSKLADIGDKPAGDIIDDDADDQFARLE